MMNKTKTAPAIIIVALVTAVMAMSLVECTDAGNDAVFKDPSGISVVAGRTGMYVTNNTGGVVHCFSIESRSAAFVDWIQSCDAPTGVEANATKEFPYSGVYGYYRGCTIQFYWWHCTEGIDGGVQPGSLRSTGIKTW